MQNNLLLSTYLIITAADSEHELSLRAFLQMCNWSRKYPKQHTSTNMLFGTLNEYVFYNAELTSEEVMLLKLKFGTDMNIGLDDYKHETNLDKFSRIMKKEYIW